MRRSSEQRAVTPEDVILGWQTYLRTSGIIPQGYAQKGKGKCLQAVMSYCLGGTEIGGLASRIAAERALLNQRMQGIFHPLLAEWQAAHAGAAQNLTLGEIANRCLQVRYLVNCFA
jgi:hypothetical protein